MTAARDGSADVYLVLGAHRSGTSAVAGALAELGLDVGEPLLAANSANPTGYYELESLVDFHESALRTMNRSWDDPRPIRLRSLAPADRETAKRKAGTLLANTFGDDTTKALIKDPRQCRLLGLWDKALEAHDPHYILVHRPAAEVAGSMAKQWGTSPERAGLLWLVHVLDAEASTRGQTRALLSYDQLLRQPLDTLKHLGRSLGTTWPIPPAAAKDALTTFLQPKMRHHRSNKPDFGDLAPIIDQLEAALDRGSDDDTFHAVVDRCRAKTAVQLAKLDDAAFEHANSLARRNADEIIRMDGRLDEQSGWLKTLSGQVEDIEGKLAGQGNASNGNGNAGGGGNSSSSDEPSEIAKLAFKVDDAASKTAKFEMRLRELATRKEVRQLAGKVDKLTKAAADTPEPAQVQPGKNNGAGQNKGAGNGASGPNKAAPMNLVRKVQQQLNILGDRVESLEAAGRVRANRSAAAGSTADLQRELDEAHRLLGEHQKWLQQLAKDVRELRAADVEQQKWLKQISHDAGENSGHIVRIQREITPTAPAPLVRRVAARTSRVPRAQVKRWRVNRMRDLAPANPTIGQETMGRLLAGTQPKEPTTPLRDLSFGRSDEPTLSIVIAAYNQFDLTARALASIFENPASAEVEIILADDGSTDPNMARFNDVPGLTVVRSEENRGFLKTVNAAAAEARGDYLLLLNNDAFVTPGCLDAMLMTFVDQRNVGVVGAKLLNPSGSVQEAGGIVWADGSAWNYGRGLHPEEPVLNYSRTVDYVSGAALMIVREIWDSLSGFDPAYAPAYYEDTDLCMRVNQLDLRVVYQSAAAVVHNEGSSYGTDETFDGKRYQTVNQATFIERWGKELSNRRSNGEAPELEKERSVNHRTLVIDARMLYPDRDSGSLRMQRLLREIGRCGSKPTFLPLNLKIEEPYATDLGALGVEVWGDPFVKSVEEYLVERGHLYDRIVLSRVEVADACLEKVRQHCPNATVVFDTVDLHFLRLERELNVRGSLAGGFDLEQITRDELAAINGADVTWVCSSVERDLLAERAPDAIVEVVSNIHDEEITETEVEGRKDLLFVGGFEHPPNLDGIRWFVEEVFPAIRADAPGITLHIVGSSTNDEVVQLEGDGIVVHGHVADLRSLYERCRVVVAPLRYGAGVKGKVTQAMALGVPVVATSMAAEGLDAQDEEHLLIADDSSLFAMRVLRLLTEDDLWVWVRTCGRKLVADQFSPDATHGALDPAVVVAQQR